MHNDHVFVSYTDQATYRDFYCGIAKEKLALRQVVVLIPSMEGIDSVKKSLKQSGLDEAPRYMSNGSLIIASDIRTLFGPEKKIIEYLKSIKDTASKSNGSRVTILVDYSIFNYDETCNIMDCESGIRSIIIQDGGMISMICSFRRSEMFDRLSVMMREAFIARGHGEILAIDNSALADPNVDARPW